MFDDFRAGCDSLIDKKSAEQSEITVWEHPWFKAGCDSNWRPVDNTGTNLGVSSK